MNGAQPRKRYDNLLTLPKDYQRKGMFFSTLTSITRRRQKKRMKDDVQLLAGRYRKGHGCDYQIGEVQFDEGITRGEDINNFHPKLRSKEDE